MLLGARQFFEKRGGGGWQNPYVTDGLVAMWDGEWNAGGGVHDETATAWVDLCGNESDLYDVFGGNLSFGNNCLIGEQNICPYNETSGRLFKPDKTYTVECCFKNSAMTYGVFAFTNGQQGATYGTGIARETWTPSLAVKTPLLYTFGNTQTSAGEIAHGDVACLSIRHGDEYSCYQNGIFLTSATAGTAGRDSLMIGNFVNLGTLSQQICCFSEYYNFRIYDRALTADEIAANYAIDKARFNLP